MEAIKKESAQGKAGFERALGRLRCLIRELRWPHYAVTAFITEV